MTVSAVGNVGLKGIKLLYIRIIKVFIYSDIFRVNVLYDKQALL